MTDTQHTPLPWRVVKLGEQVYIEHEHGFICDLQAKDALKDERAEIEANAAYITKACNAYPELVKALRGVVDSYERSNAELIRAGMLPEGKQPKYVIEARRVLKGLEE